MMNSRTSRHYKLSLMQPIRMATPSGGQSRLPQETLDSEFHALGAEIWWFYPNVDSDNEGSSSKSWRAASSKRGFRLLEIPTIYHTRSSSATCMVGEGRNRCITRDLIIHDKHMFLSSNPYHKRDLENDLVHVELIGGDEGWRDNISGTWAELSSADGVASVLVRPDGIIAWRERKRVEAAETNINARQLTTLLQRVMKDNTPVKTWKPN